MSVEPSHDLRGGFAPELLPSDIDTITQPDVGRQSVIPAELGDTEGPLAELSPRQREAILLAAQGISYDEIADRLILGSRKIVSNYLTAAYRELGINRKTDLGYLLFNDRYAKYIDVKRMSPQQKTIFELTGEELSIKQTALRMGITAALVRKQSHVVRRRFNITNGVEFARTAHVYASGRNVARIAQTVQPIINDTICANKWLMKNLTTNPEAIASFRDMVEARIENNVAAQDVLKDPAAPTIIKEIVNHEVDFALSSN